jgi:hypothetical protein
MLDWLLWVPRNRLCVCSPAPRAILDGMPSPLLLLAPGTDSFSSIRGSYAPSPADQLQEGRYRLYIGLSDQLTVAKPAVIRPGRDQLTVAPATNLPRQSVSSRKDRQYPPSCLPRTRCDGVRVSFMPPRDQLTVAVFRQFSTLPIPSTPRAGTRVTRCNGAWIGRWVVRVTGTWVGIWRRAAGYAPGTIPGRRP